jgi:hypothetical protein
VPLRRRRAELVSILLDLKRPGRKIRPFCLQASSVVLLRRRTAERRVLTDRQRQSKTTFATAQRSERWPLPPVQSILACCFRETLPRREKASMSICTNELAPWLTAPKSYRNLRTSIRTALGFPKERRPLLIGIDGLDGSGKTSLAAWLSWQLEMPAVHLDLYMMRDSNPLQFRAHDLKAALDARATQERPVIVEGILLLKVLDEISRTPDLLVFVRRASHQSSLRTLTTKYLREFAPQQKADWIVRWSSAGRDRKIVRAHQNNL